MNNPYISDGKPKLQNSFCVFADILGYQERTLEAYKNGKEAEFFDSLLLTINEGVNQIQQDEQEVKDGGRRMWIHKTFSDNIILGCPIYFPHLGESEWWMTISQIAQYQLTMVLGGFFIRGALSFGPLYIDDEMIFGLSLIEAVDLEKKAKYPRIVISSTAMDIVKEQMNFYANHRESPHNAELLVGDDDQCFIDYLSVGEDERTRANDALILERHKAVIVRNLNQYKNDDTVKDKYLWAAAYHNYYCKRIKQSEYGIKVVNSTYKFRRLIE